MYRYRENDQLAYALILLGACQDQIEQYGYMTLAQFHRQSTGDDYRAWDWIYDEIEVEVMNVPGATINRMHNALFYNLINDPRNSWEIDTEDSSCADKAIQACKKTFSPRALHILLNKALGQL